MPGKRERRSLRLPHYNYTSAGAYFITVATRQWQQFFGTVVGEKMHLNEIGEIVQQEWQRTESMRTGIALDEFIVMPNHFHGIIFIHETESNQRVGAQRAAPLRKNAQGRPFVEPGSLGAIVRAFKSAATRRINLLRSTPGAPVWQRNYYERVIRDDEELHHIREYILDNPRKWAEDEDNPSNWASRQS